VGEREGALSNFFFVVVVVGVGVKTKDWIRERSALLLGRFDVSNDLDFSFKTSQPVSRSQTNQPGTSPLDFVTQSIVLAPTSGLFNPTPSQPNPNN
jgi:hypothetical protein